MHSVYSTRIERYARTAGEWGVCTLITVNDIQFKLPGVYITYVFVPS